MSLEERSVNNSCQDKNFNDALSETHSEGFLSPTRRSSRIRKLQVSADYCNTKETVEKTIATSKSKEPLVENTNTPLDIAASNQVNYSHNSKDNELSDSSRSIEKSGSFFQTDSDEDQSFESMFDDIFGQRYTKTLKSLLPKKLNDDCIKERKFFKRRALESPNAMFPNCYTNSKSNLPAEDVSKVFKIISKPNILSDLPTNSKPCGKPSLKTYCNKRKKFQQSNVVESFGLPDYPIVSENGIKPVTNNKLDAEILDASEITILNMEYTDEPWIITNIEGESLFPYYEEVRIKAEPVKHDHFRVNGLFSENVDVENLEKCSDFNILTPLNSRNYVNNRKFPVSSTPKNPKTINKGREIDIETIKLNFKKILTKKVDHHSVPKDEVKKNVSQRRKTAFSQSKTCKASVGSEISFVTNHSLTVENKEFEISNALSVPKINSSNISDCDPKKNILLCGKKDSKKRENVTKSIQKQMRSNVKCSSNARKQLEQANDMISPQENKRTLRSSTCKDLRNADEGDLPKKTIETDLNSTPGTLNSKKKFVEDQKGGRLCNEESGMGELPKDTGKKRLRSIDRSKATDFSEKGQQKRNLKRKSLSDSQITVKIEGLERNGRPKVNLRNTSAPNLTGAEKQANAEEKTAKLKVTSPSIVCKRRLRSSSQENFVKDVQETVTVAAKKAENTTKKTQSQHLKRTNIAHDFANEDLATNVKVSLEKCDHKLNVNEKKHEKIATASKVKDGKLNVLKRSKTETDLLPNTRKNVSKSGYARLLSPLKTGKKSKSEIKIVITPLDMSQLLAKVPDRISNECNQPDILSPTRRKLRSAKMLVHSTLPNQNRTVETEGEKILSKKYNKVLNAPEIIAKADILHNLSSASKEPQCPNSSNSCNRVEGLPENKDEFVNTTLCPSDKIVAEKINEPTPTKNSVEFPVSLGSHSALPTVDIPAEFTAQKEKEMSKNATVTAEEDDEKTEPNSNVTINQQNEHVKVTEEQGTMELQNPSESTNTERRNSYLTLNKTPLDIQIRCGILEVCIAQKCDLETDLVKVDLVEEKRKLTASKVGTKKAHIGVDVEETTECVKKFDRSNFDKKEKLHKEEKKIQSLEAGQNITENFDTHDKTGTLENSVSTETTNDFCRKLNTNVEKLETLTTEKIEVCDKQEIDLEKPRNENKSATTHDEPLNIEVPRGFDNSLNGKLVENYENRTPLPGHNHFADSSDPSSGVKASDATVSRNFQTNEECTYMEEKTDAADNKCEEACENSSEKVKKITVSSDLGLKEKRSKLTSEKTSGILDKITEDDQCAKDLKSAALSENSLSDVSEGLEGSSFFETAEHKDFVTNSGRKGVRSRRKLMHRLENGIVSKSVHISEEYASMKEKSNVTHNKCEEELSENSPKKLKKKPISSGSGLKEKISELIDQKSPPVLDQITKDNQCTKDLKLVDVSIDSPTDVSEGLDCNGFSEKVENKDNVTNSGCKRIRPPKEKSVDHLENGNKITNATDAIASRNLQTDEGNASTKESSNVTSSKYEELLELKKNPMSSDSGLKEKRIEVTNERSSSVSDEITNDNQCGIELRLADVSKDSSPDANEGVDHKDIVTNSRRRRGRTPKLRSMDHLEDGNKITNPTDAVLSREFQTDEEYPSAEERSNVTHNKYEEATELREGSPEKLKKKSISSDSNLKENRSKLISEELPPILDKTAKANQCPRELKPADISEDSSSDANEGLDSNAFSEKTEDKDNVTNSGCRRGRPPRGKSVDHLVIENNIINATDAIASSNLQTDEGSASTKEKSNVTYNKCEELRESKKKAISSYSGLKEKRAKVTNERSASVSDEITKDNQCAIELRSDDISKDSSSNANEGVDSSGCSAKADHKDIVTNNRRRRGRTPKIRSVDHLEDGNKITNAIDAVASRNFQTDEEYASAEDRSSVTHNKYEEATELREVAPEKLKKKSISSDSHLKEKRSNLISELLPVLDKVAKDRQSPRGLKLADISKDSPSDASEGLDCRGFSAEAEDKNNVINSGRKRGRPPKGKSVDHLEIGNKITNATATVASRNFQTDEGYASTKEGSNVAHTKCQEATELDEGPSEKIKSISCDTDLKENRSKLQSKEPLPVLDKIAPDKQSPKGLKPADVSKNSHSNANESLECFSEKAKDKDDVINRCCKRGRPPRGKSVDHLEVENKRTNAADAIVSRNLQFDERNASAEERTNVTYNKCEEFRELRKNSISSDSGLKEKRSEAINERSPSVSDEITKDNQCTLKLRPADVSKNSSSDAIEGLDSTNFPQKAEHKGIVTNSGRKRGRPSKKKSLNHLGNENITATDAIASRNLQNTEENASMKGKSDVAHNNCEKAGKTLSPSDSGVKENRSKSVREESPSILYKITNDNQCTNELKPADLSEDSPSDSKTLDHGGFSNNREHKNIVTISGRKRGRPRRKSVDHLETPRKEDEGYKNRLRRSKSVIPRIFDLRSRLFDADIDIRSRRKSNKLNTSKDVAVSDKGVEWSRTLRRCKSFTHITLHSRKKDSDLSVNNNSERKSKDCMEIKGRLQNIRNDTKSDDRLDFQVGDLAWAQIGAHPFWPCLVTEDPETRSHKKIIDTKRYRRIMYHVRFFGDNGRRAWIRKRQIMLYCSRDDLKVLMNRFRDEKKSFMLRACIIQTNRLEKWQRAVNEAEFLKTKSLREKLSFFYKLFNAKVEKSTKNEPPLVKRKRKDTIEESEIKEELMTEDEAEENLPARKRLRNNVEEETEIKDEKDVALDSLNESPSVDSNSESISSKLRLKRHTDDVSDVDSKSSDNTTDTTLYSMEAQKALFKRNYLFKGVSRDKVCQHCCQPGEVLKCRGRCNGSYHVDCATKILEEKSVKKKREKNHDDLTFPEKTSPSEDAETKLRGYFGAEYNLRHSNRNRDKECVNAAEVVKLDMLEDEQVQIITVPSSVYNTPPRKTFPPDFKNMTLAEQIDYKMKEIMRKFESKTFYADSSSDSSAEESQPLTNINHFSKCEALFSANATSATDVDLKLNKDEPRKDDNISYGIKIPNTLDINRDSDIKPTLNVKRKSFVKHITADSDTIDHLISDTLQENKSDVSVTSTDTGKMVDPKNFKCGFCVSDLDPFCFVCCQSVSRKGSTFRQKCSLYQCGRFYHPECLKMWPQTQWSLIQTTKHKDSDQVVDSFVCPLHVCHTCVSDDPRAATSRCSGDKIVKCLRCPSTYHSTNFCVPAGTSILSSTQIVCPRHRDRSRFCTINTTWCFLCSEGGNLICCETCPTSVHPECLPVNLTDDDKFICEDCESGRLPLYDEIVWVKLGKFRWWPALILFPNEVPANVLNIKHASGEFVVKFFGTYDYYWVNRGRSFLFQDGDTGHCSSVKKKVDAAFNTAVEEAVAAHKLKKEFKLSQEAESITSLKPPPYIRIKVNKPVGNVRQLDLDLSSTNACECDPSRPHPCGPDSDCLNRLLLTECNPDMCPAGKRCKNQSFEKREYPPLVPYKTQGRGWGLKTLAPIKKGQFVIEYVGEMIDIEEYQRRLQKMHEQKEENYYFLTIDKDRMLDAGPKGNLARFMNHCCQPNCETQKWTVNGDTRVGLFATKDIPAETELTFNYNLECVGKEKKVCRCGAPNCSGFIGVKAKQDAELRKPKKPFKKKALVEPIILPPCFICGRKGNVRACNNKVCSKVYHLRCLKLTKWPEGNKFICPWHHCNVCSKRTIRCCIRCVNSFCPSHSDGNIRYDNLGFVCSSHDPVKASNGAEPATLKKRRSDVITLTPTTSDDVEDEDLTPFFLTRARLKKAKKKTAMDSESENDCSVKSTPPRRRRAQRRYSDSESLEESAVSSATLTDVEEEVVAKRKRGRPRKSDEFMKRIKLCNVQNHENTANSSLNDDRLRNDTNPKLSSRGNELENR